MSHRRKIVLCVAAAATVVIAALLVLPGSPGRKAVFLARNMECFQRPHDGGRIGAIGDSITAGTSDPDWGFLGSNSWVSHVVCDSDLTYAYNAASPNQTTEIVAERLPELLEHDPDVVVVLTGTNDILKRRSLPAAVKVIDGMVQQIRAQGATPVLGTVPPFEANPQGARDFNGLLTAYARESDVQTIDFYAALQQNGDWRPGLSADGLHPTVDGARVMAQTATPVLSRVR